MEGIRHRIKLIVPLANMLLIMSHAFGTETKKHHSAMFCKKGVVLS